MKTTHGNFRFKASEIGIFNTASVLPITAKLNKTERIIGLTNGKFSLIDLIAGILQKTGPAHLVVATWSAGIKDAHQCKWLLDSDKVASMRLITDHSYPTRQRKYALSITDLFGKENIRTAESHAKFVLIHNDEFQITIRTSMNLNANKTCETFEIDLDPDVFNLFWQWCKSHWNDMPEGFCSSPWKAGNALKQFFTGDAFNETAYSGWSDL